jgi:hypothetical protein
MSDHGQKLADSGAVVAWVAYILSHLPQINQVLQTLALVTAIFASIAAGLYHLRKWRRMR